MVSTDMKNIITKYSAWILIAVMIVLLIPGLNLRISNESQNKNVVISVLYNDILNKVSKDTLDTFLDECKKEGIDTVSIKEDDINGLALRGEVTAIRYNALSNRYDEDSIRITEAIKENCPKVSFESHIVIADKPYVKEKLSYMIPRRFDKNTYTSVKDVDGNDIYVFYNGIKEQWDYAFGFDEKLLSDIHSKGFNIALIYKVKNYAKTDYLKDMDRIIKKYDVEYLNLKNDTSKQDIKETNLKNVEGISKIIEDNNMTLVVTENSNQLSNQMFMGYSDIFKNVMNTSGKVMRSYETNDNSQAEGEDYTYRVSQLFNSTVDRNTRFITLTQLVLPKVSYDDCAAYTLYAAKEYKAKIESLGYSVNADPVSFNYVANKELNFASCAAIMVMFAYIMFCIVSGINSFILSLAAIALSAFAFLASFVMPSALLNLYPTVFSAIQSCFAMTLLLAFIKKYSKSLSFAYLMLSSLVILLSSLLISSVGMSVMLSGINYYVNNDIFRGIKVSLLAPVFYTMIAYYYMFIKTDETKVLKTASKILKSEIKVYWLIFALALGGIGAYYIIRSGNVSSISGFETLLRNKVTEIFPARPRTKEFLIGYPSLVLFVYYTKHHNIKLASWIFAVGTAILAASVTNSFCHVFTDYTTIVMRVVNGLICGAFVSIAVYVCNLILVKLAAFVKKLS